MTDLKRPTNGAVRPRIILHGGAGSMTRKTLAPETYEAYRRSMLEMLESATSKLHAPGATALDIATYAVTLLENNVLFNAGHGAVFTTAGTHELEASVMVSRGYRKRGTGVMEVRTAKNPILLAKEMLIRGEEKNGDGAQQHSQLCGDTCDELAQRWGLQTERPSYFYSWKSWSQHRKDLGLSVSKEEYQKAKNDADVKAGYSPIDEDSADSEDVKEAQAVDLTAKSVDSSFVPRGTVGAVVLDSTGTLCAATSTGGRTNKLPGRIGDTPTLGAGFWAEEWFTTHSRAEEDEKSGSIVQSLTNLALECLPSTSSSASRPTRRIRGAAISGTGDGDTFLRINAARTAVAMPRFSRSSHHEDISLQDSVTATAGPGGFLELAAEDRWGSGTGEGEGGMIGIELDNGVGKVVFDYNCGGLIHAWVDDEGKHRFAAFQDEKCLT